MSQLRHWDMGSRGREAVVTPSFEIGKSRQAGNGRDRGVLGKGGGAPS